MKEDGRGGDSFYRITCFLNTNSNYSGQLLPENRVTRECRVSRKNKNHIIVVTKYRGCSLFS